MGPELEHVADLRNRNRIGVRLKRPHLGRLECVPDDNVVDFTDREAGNLDRRIFQDELLELDLELIEIPASRLAKAIDCEAKQTLLLGGMMIHANAGKAAEAQQLGGLQPDLTVDQIVAVAYQKGITKAEGGDRCRDLAHMRGIQFAQLALGGTQLIDRQINDRECRQEIVTARVWTDRYLRHAQKRAATVTALGFQLLVQGRRG
jgi:hypothetical protein